MNRFEMLSAILLCALLIPSTGMEAQGPRPSYFFHPHTEVPWAECVLYQGGGSMQKIPFLPVVNTGFFRAPLGTANLTRDVAVDAPLVFIGNGIVLEGEWNSYEGRRADWSQGEIDVSGKIVLFSFDAPDAIQEELGKTVPLSSRIREAADRGAAAVVLFSTREAYPFLTVHYGTESEIPDIPVITVARQSALDIFAASGVFNDTILKDWEQTQTPPESMELITSMRIRFDGAFESVETKNFTFRYPRDAYCDEEMRRIVELNERSLAFLFETLQDRDTLRWNKLLTVSFPAFDIKFFYTAHVGRGLASDAGVFNAFDGEVPDYGLIVHENMHVLTNLNWSRNTRSFLSEGIAKHAEALATEKGDNHRRTAAILEQGRLLPLGEMMTFHIIGEVGSHPDVSYPASGSFVGFLIERYGLVPFREAYVLEGRRPEERDADDTWTRVYGKSLRDLETDWLNWLAKECGINDELLQNHLEVVAECGREASADPAVLDE